MIKVSWVFEESCAFVCKHALLQSFCPRECFTLSVSPIHTSSDLWPVHYNPMLTKLPLSLVTPLIRVQCLNLVVVAGAVCELGTKLLPGMYANWIAASKSLYQGKKIAAADSWSRDDKVGPSMRDGSWGRWANSDAFAAMHIVAWDCPTKMSIQDSKSTHLSLLPFSLSHIILFPLSLIKHPALFPGQN